MYRFSGADAGSPLKMGREGRNYGRGTVKGWERDGLEGQVREGTEGYKGMDTGGEGKAGWKNGKRKGEYGAPYMNLARGP